VIDADLQDPPEVIPQMLQRWRDGADVAYGKRARRDGESAFKLLSASAFYRLIDRVSDISIPLDTGDFRLMDRRVVDAFLMMPERDRFVRGMIAWAGYRQEPVLYDRSPRFAGASRYTFPKMVAFAINGILSFSLLPLRIASFVGFFAAMLSTIGIVYALVARLLTDDWVPGWAFLIIAIFFIGGVQLVVLGIIGEYLGRVYGEVKRRPLYLLKERIGFGERQAVGTDRDDFRSPEAPSRPTATPDATSSGNRTTDVDALEPRSAGASPDTNGPPGPRGFSA
jgi:glycosyltransferase involved in cell wall biosynthesis